MMCKPKISVLIPVYNSEKYIKRCIKSVLSQTFLDFEPTERLFDAVVPVIALSPRIVLCLRHEAQSEAKMPPFIEASVYYNSVSQDAVAENR